MNEAADRWSRASILRELRRALRHLYDPDELRSNALMMLLPPGDRDRHSTLQRVLITDPGLGVARHADAGYPEVVEFAKTYGIQIPTI